MTDPLAKMLLRWTERRGLYVDSGWWVCK